MTQPVPTPSPRFFLERAYTEGGGTNVVNVILVDFRGFDTLGEITVLGVVAMTVYALLRRFRPAPESIRPSQETAVSTSLAGDLRVSSVTMRLFFPVIGMVALYLFLRGHDHPGGGFVAGITLSVAFILQYIARGTRWVEDHLRIHPVRWMAAGLLCAVATGVGAWFLGEPFLTGHHGHLDLPLVGEVACGLGALLRPGGVPVGGRRHRADPHRAGPPVDPYPPGRRRARLHFREG